MKYSDLVLLVQEILGDSATKKFSEEFLDVIFGTITEALQSGDEVTIKNFGRFYPVQRAPRTAHNPHTGEPIEVPSKTVIKFAPRGELKMGMQAADQTPELDSSED